MTHTQPGGSGNGTWPWPPEIPPPRPSEPPGEPPRTWPWPGAPTPILPTWEEAGATRREKDLADRLLDQRIVLVNGRLDDALADHVSRQLLLLGSTDPDRPIELHLSCRDAELSASVALATAMDLTRADVHTIVSGLLGTPALAVVCASAKRSAHRKATFVLSLPRESGEGTATELATKAEEHELLVSQLVERVSAVTGRRDEDVATDLQSDRLLSAEEAAAYGLVDHLL
ncbi:MAG: ATP-dependent Clp protease proteolytic subunit [Actinomycetota bacterium]|nr:ATP-dependent Clp protease proteolytic subunit [Actinomycetota bacterium]